MAKGLTEEELAGLKLSTSHNGCLPAGREDEVCAWLNAEEGRRAEWREFNLLFRDPSGCYRMVCWGPYGQRWYVSPGWWSFVDDSRRFLRPRG